MQLIYPTSGPRGNSGPAGRRRGREAAHRLSSRKPLFLRLPDGGRAAHVFRRPDGLHAPNGAAASPALLDEVGIGGERRMQLRKFSKGMLQRVGIAQAILNDPEVVFLDEPMSGLDPLGRREVRNLILKLRDRGCTVFFSSHVLADAEALVQPRGDSGGRLAWWRPARWPTFTRSARAAGNWWSATCRPSRSSAIARAFQQRDADCRTALRAGAAAAAGARPAAAGPDRRGRPPGVAESDSGDARRLLRRAGEEASGPAQGRRKQAA